MELENGLSRTRKIILYHQVLDSDEMVLFHPNILEYCQLFQTIYDKKRWNHHYQWDLQTIPSTKRWNNRRENNYDIYDNTNDETYDDSHYPW